MVHLKFKTSPWTKTEEGSFHAAASPRVYAGEDGIVRSATVKSCSGELKGRSVKQEIFLFGGRSGSQPNKNLFASQFV